MVGVVGAQRRDGAVRARSLHQPDLTRVDGGGQRLGTVARRHQEDLGAGRGGGDDLLLDATDGSNASGVTDGSRPGDVGPAGQRPRGQRVVDREGEDQAGAGSADPVAEPHRDVEGKGVAVADLDPDDGPLLVLRRGGRGDLDGPGPARPVDAEGGRPARPAALDRVGDLAEVADRRAVDGQDLVAGLELALGRSARLHPQHLDPDLGSEAELGQRRGHGGVLGGDHVDAVLLVDLRGGLLGRIDGVAGVDGAVGVQPRPHHRQQAQLARGVGHRDGRESQLTGRGVGASALHVDDGVPAALAQDVDRRTRRHRDVGHRHDHHDGQQHQQHRGGDQRSNGPTVHPVTISSDQRDERRTVDPGVLGLGTGAPAAPALREGRTAIPVLRSRTTTGRGRPRPGCSLAIAWENRS